MPVNWSAKPKFVLGVATQPLKSPTGSGPAVGATVDPKLQLAVEHRGVGRDRRQIETQQDDVVLRPLGEQDLGSTEAPCWLIATDVRVSRDVLNVRVAALSKRSRDGPAAACAGATCGNPTGSAAAVPGLRDAVLLFDGVPADACIRTRIEIRCDNIPKTVQTLECSYGDATNITRESILDFRM